MSTFLRSRAPAVQSTTAAWATCPFCGPHKQCLPLDAIEPYATRLGHISGHRRVARGDYLYRAGDTFTHLHAIRSGDLKTSRVSADGEEQIIGFNMIGDLLGVDAIHDGRHRCNAIALEDSEVCTLSFAPLQELFLLMPRLLQHFLQLMAAEIARQQNAIILLGNTRTEQRVAAFIINLAARYLALGYSPTRFRMRMSREEMGCYLGMTNESISRALSNFKKQGVLNVDHRDLEILNVAALRAAAAGLV